MKKFNLSYFLFFPFIIRILVYLAVLEPKPFPVLNKNFTKICLTLQHNFKYIIKNCLNMFSFKDQLPSVLLFSCCYFWPHFWHSVKIWEMYNDYSSAGVPVTIIGKYCPIYLIDLYIIVDIGIPNTYVILSRFYSWQWFEQMIYVWSLYNFDILMKY